METDWIKITDNNLPQDNKEHICYGEDYMGYPVFSAIYDFLLKEWYIIEGRTRFKQFPTHYKPDLIKK